MAAGGGNGGGEDELDGLVLDDDFVRGATVIELRPHERRAAAAAAAAERAAREAPPAEHDARFRGAPDGDGLVDAAPQEGGHGLGVVVAFVAVMGTLKAMGVNQGGPTTSDAATGAAVGGQTFVAGDCVTWPDSEGEFATRIGLEVVPCTDPHRLEMVGTATLADGPYPTPTAFGRLYDERCGPLVKAHLGHDLDPAGRFAIGGLHPGIDGWRAGDRGIACAIVLRGATANGDDPLFTGAVADG